jgi:ribosomal protein S18 acetylase RimI-like enzyme
MADDVALAADACLQWHDAWLRAFGVPTASDESVWRALAQPPVIYFGAITRRRDARPESLASGFGAVCDSWSTLDLGPYGFRRLASEPWFRRLPGELPAEDPPSELEILEARSPAEIEEFEAVSIRGFQDEDATVEPGSIHPPSIVADPRMRMWLGRVVGRAVAASMSYRTDRAVGIFGVTTVSSARGRGYGTALTRAALLADTRLPAVLAPSPQAERLYQRLGFRRVGRLQKWARL